MIYPVQIGGRTRRVGLERAAGGGWRISVDGKPLTVDVARVASGTLSLLLDGGARSLCFAWERQETTPAGARFWLGAPGGECTAEVRDPRRLSARGQVEQSGRALLKAPMAGKVVRVLKAVGDEVEAGEDVLVLEAMKMQNAVRSPKSGRLITLTVQPGATVPAGRLLAEVE